MNRDEIEKLVTSYIEQSIGGLEIENAKFDFKRAWYDLASKPGINEFLKDTSAIANTFGPDGFIVIGFDDKAKEFHHSIFKNSRLNDTSKIPDLINKKVDRLFSINIYDFIVLGHQLSVIHIPPSIDKPHVLPLYQTFDEFGKIKKEDKHKTFVRKGTRTYDATRNDFELMYWDRQNVAPDYKLAVSATRRDFILSIQQYQKSKDGVPVITYGIISAPYLYLENSGRRPVSIRRITVDLYLFEDPTDNEILKLIGDVRAVLQAGEVKELQVDFKGDNNATIKDSLVSQSDDFNINMHNLLTKTIRLELSDGQFVDADFLISK